MSRIEFQLRGGVKHRVQRRVPGSLFAAKRCLVPHGKGIERTSSVAELMDTARSYAKCADHADVSPVPRIAMGGLGSAQNPPPRAAGAGLGHGRGESLLSTPLLLCVVSCDVIAMELAAKRL